MIMGMSDVCVREIFAAEPVEAIGGARTSTSVTGLRVSRPSLSALPSPTYGFCPQSAGGRCSMGSDEDRPVDLNTCSHSMLLLGS